MTRALATKAGDIYGRLICLDPKYAKNKCRQYKGLYACSCGKQVVTCNNSVRRGRSSSCGCLRREQAAEQSKIHGLSDTKEYRAWQHMKDRCLNANIQNYHNYGGRGISVCAAWLESFETFFEDVGPAPSPKHSIDRTNNDGNYEPGNCRWATASEQNSNQRSRQARS